MESEEIRNLFIFIPLVLILSSLVGIFVIIWRKMPYLKKLSVVEVQLGSNMWADIFPELSKGMNGTSNRLKRYREVWLLELEKFLRRLRVWSLRTDRMSDSLIKKIRRFTERKQNNTSVSPGEDMNPVRSLARPPGADESRRDLGEATSNGTKKEEQKLIIEIAKNPKNSSLYEVLGDLYMKMGNFSDAKESYEAAIELNSNNEELKKKLSLVLEGLIQK